MKTFLFLMAIAVSITAGSQQITKVSLQASGLTCSMCSNSINKALKTVDFVDNVNANVQNSSFEITFKHSKKVDFDILKKKVEDAGFSVSKFIAFINFNNVRIKTNEAVTIGSNTFLFTNVKEEVVKGEIPVHILDKGFVSPKEYKKNPVTQTAERTYHANI
jgi:copper chaperone CopZ